MWAASPETYQDADDLYLEEQNPTTVRDLLYVSVRAESGGYRKRAMLQFDFTALPAGVTITNATFSMYYYLISGTNPVGRTYNARRIVRNDWDPAAAVWDYYKDTTVWSTAGADNTSTDVSNTDLATDTVPASYGWMDWDVTNIVITEQADNEVLNIQVYDNDEIEGSYLQASFYSSTYVTDTAKQPKLVITYTTSGSFIPTIAIY